MKCTQQEGKADREEMGTLSILVSARLCKLVGEAMQFREIGEDDGRKDGKEMSLQL